MIVEDYIYKVIRYLYEKNIPLNMQDISENLNISVSKISAAGMFLQEHGLIDIEEQKIKEVLLTQSGEEAINKGLIERKIVEELIKHGGKLHLKDLSRNLNIEQSDVGKCLKVLKMNNWAEVKDGELSLISDQDFLNQLSPEEKILNILKDKKSILLNELIKKGIDEKIIENMSKLRKFILIKERTIRIFKITQKGKEKIDTISPLVEVTQLTSEMLIKKTWKDVSFKKYDVSLDVSPIYPGKVHPFRRIINQTRRVFVEMGFKEVKSPFVESAFWGFDALFQPQDHPAREMQDTFYVKKTDLVKDILPEDTEIIERVKQTHENGWETGSLGWQYKWDLEKSKELVLRTHTTAASIRSIAINPSSPQKIFCIGPVFRREAIDFKHLPVFHQIDGIIIDNKAAFVNLLGTLEIFYKKMGFEKIEFRPSYFPYTEPSLEIFVYMEEKKDWIEMGGAGIFREEVVKPFGCEVPVLAWGLGLERLAMFRYGLTDIRELYFSDIAWLREVPLCQ